MDIAYIENVKVMNHRRSCAESATIMQGTECTVHRTISCMTLVQVKGIVSHRRKGARMTDKERIERLERRADTFEETLRETLKQLNRLADLLLKLSQTLLEQQKEWL